MKVIFILQSQPTTSKCAGCPYIGSCLYRDAGECE